MVKSGKTAEETHWNSGGSTNRNAPTLIKHDYLLVFACDKQRSQDVFNCHSSMEPGTSSW